MTLTYIRSKIYRMANPDFQCLSAGRCPAGVGKWAASYVQPALPCTDPEETTFDNPFLGKNKAILALSVHP